MTLELIHFCDNFWLCQNLILFLPCCICAKWIRCVILAWESTNMKPKNFILEFLFISLYVSHWLLLFTSIFLFISPLFLFFLNHNWYESIVSELSLLCVLQIVLSGYLFLYPGSVYITKNTWSHHTDSLFLFCTFILWFLLTS